MYRIKLLLHFYGQFILLPNLAKWKRVSLLYMFRKGWRQRTKTSQFQKCLHLYYAIWACILSVYSNCASKTQTRHTATTYGYHEFIYNFGIPPCAQWDGIGIHRVLQKKTDLISSVRCNKGFRNPLRFWEKVSEDTQKGTSGFQHVLCILFHTMKTKRGLEEGTESTSSSVWLLSFNLLQFWDKCSLMNLSI